MSKTLFSTLFVLVLLDRKVMMAEGRLANEYKLTAKLSEMDNEAEVRRANLELRNKDLEDRVQTQKEALSMLRKDYAELQDRYTAQFQEQERLIGKLQAQLDAQESPDVSCTIADLRKEIEELRDNYARAIKRSDHAEMYYKYCERELERAKRQLRDMYEGLNVPNIKDWKPEDTIETPRQNPFGSPAVIAEMEARVKEHQKEIEDRLDE